MTTMFDGNPDLGMFVIPLIIYHASQLFVGTAVSGRFSKWVESESESENESGDGTAAGGREAVQTALENAKPGSLSVEMHLPPQAVTTI